MNCFNCEMLRACKLGLDLVIQKKIYSKNFNRLKRQPPNEKHQMLPKYINEYEPTQNIIHFESARGILVKEDYKMIVRRGFERIYNTMDCKWYKKNEDFLENKEIFIYAFKLI